jgi:hypothetical protein
MVTLRAHRAIQPVFAVLDLLDLWVEACGIRTSDCTKRGKTRQQPISLGSRMHTFRHSDVSHS